MSAASVVPLRDFAQVVKSNFRERGMLTTLPDVSRSGFALENLYGRLCELSGEEDSAVLSVAFSLALKAQQEKEPVAFIGLKDNCFYPPDVAACGVDLESLVVVQVDEVRDVPLCAEQLLRSGAFGLLLLDVKENPRVPPPLMTRIMGLLRKHDSAFVFLSENGCQHSSLGSLISLRARATRKYIPPPVQISDRHISGVRGVGHFECEVEVIKDKRGPPGAIQNESYRGPPGLY